MSLYDLPIHGADTYTYSTPVLMFSAEVPCKCGATARIDVPFGKDYPTRYRVPCPGCDREYVVYAPRPDDDDNN